MQRATVEAEGSDAGSGAVDGQGSRFAERGQQPMQRGMGRAGGTEAGRGSVTGLDVSFADHGQQPMQRAVVAATAIPGVRPVAGAGSGQAGEGPFRRVLLASTARSEPVVRPYYRARRDLAVREVAAQEVAARTAERAGEWTIALAFRDAQQQGKDWRPGVAEALRRRAGDARRLVARGVLRVGAVADVGRWDGFVGGGE